MSIAYYRALFDGSLGFERAADFTSYPVARPAPRSPTTAPRSSSPSTTIRASCSSARRAKFSPAAARRLLLGAMPQTPPTMNDWERWPRALRQVSAPVRPDRRAAAEHAAPSVEPADAPASSLVRRRSSGTSRCSRWASPRCRSPGRSSRASQDRGFGFARLARPRARDLRPDRRPHLPRDAQRPRAPRSCASRPSRSSRRSSRSASATTSGASCASTAARSSRARSSSRRASCSSSGCAPSTPRSTGARSPWTSRS